VAFRLDGGRSSHRRLGVIGTLTLLLLSMLAVTPGVSAATAPSWLAKLSSGAFYGSGLLASTTSTSPLRLSLVIKRMAASTTYPVVLRRGTCVRLGTVVTTLPQIKTSSLGTASRVSIFTVTQTTAVRRALGAGPVVLRVGTRCGNLASVAPPPEPRVDLQVVGFSRLGTGTDARIAVEVRNPNQTWGIVRGGFELTTLDASGAVIAVQGAGLPGTACCTIYQLAPGASWLISAPLDRADEVAKVEIHATSGWYLWSSVAPHVPTTTITGPSLDIRDFVGGAVRDVHVTGRVSVTGVGPFNVVVNVRVAGADGWLFLQTTIDCIGSGTDYAFDASDLVVPPTGAALDRVWAVTSTVPGVGAVTQAPGCS
jgi:hypothetical protein